MLTTTRSLPVPLLLPGLVSVEARLIAALGVSKMRAALLVLLGSTTDAHAARPSATDAAAEPVPVEALSLRALSSGALTLALRLALSLLYRCTASRRRGDVLGGVRLVRRLR